MEFKPGEKLIVVHFGELWLKGRNRNSYIKLLVKNLGMQLEGERFALVRQYDRLILKLEKKSNLESIRTKLKRVFGISAFQVSIAAKPALKEIKSAARRMLSGGKRPKVLKIDSHRSYKQHKFTSIDVVNGLKPVAEKLGIDPDLRGYDKILSVSIAKDAAFLSLDKEKGAGGLPVGSSGKAIILISGGIDSPVAAWYAMKRGLEPIYVHLHAFQKNSEALAGKVPRIIRHLAGFYPHYASYVVPAHIFQAKASKYGRYELILLKAFMLRLAEKIARKENAAIIFTGESLGQVASQTAENLCAEQYGIAMPILRPLVGFDKEEIIGIAKSIGTFEDSIKPYKDVCSINSRNPKTAVNIDEMKNLLNEIDLEKLVGRSMELSNKSVH